MTENSGIFDLDSALTNTEYDNPGETIVQSEESLLETLVGEGKKFKSVEALAKGKILSDAFVERLKEENRLAREEIERLRQERGNESKIDVLLQRLQGNQAQMSSGFNQPTESREAPIQNEPVSPELIAENVLSLIEKRTNERTELENINYVGLSLKESFGSDWKNKLREFGNSLGVDEVIIDSWVKKNPKALVEQVRKAFKPASPPVNVRNSFNTSGLNVDSTGARNMSYYKKIKEKDPKRYWSNAVQLDMHKDALKLGEKFFT